MSDQKFFIVSWLFPVYNYPYGLTCLYMSHWGYICMHLNMFPPTHDNEFVGACVCVIQGPILCLCDNVCATANCRINRFPWCLSSGGCINTWDNYCVCFSCVCEIERILLLFAVFSNKVIVTCVTCFLSIGTDDPILNDYDLDVSGCMISLLFVFDIWW